MMRLIGGGTYRLRPDFGTEAALGKDAHQGGWTRQWVPSYGP